MLVVATRSLLVGFAVMFYITVQNVNDRVDEVNTQIDRSVNQLRTDVRKELDARIPPGGIGARSDAGADGGPAPHRGADSGPAGDHAHADAVADRRG